MTKGRSQCLGKGSFRSIAAALLLAALALPAHAQGPGKSGAAVAEYDEKTLAPADVSFQRGVFRVGEPGDRIEALCIPVEGVWRQAGSMTDCGADPPETRRREAERYKPDTTVMVVRNLGVDRAQWDASGATSGAMIGAIRKSFSYSISPTEVRWRFDSRSLPAPLRTPIPGSGIHVHFGGLFSDARMPKLFEPGQGDLQVEARMALPVSVRIKNAHSGVTLAIVVQAQTVSGDWVGIPVIVSVFNRELATREAIRSDGRVSFAATFLGPGTQYVERVQNAQKTEAWSEFETFSFRISRANAKRLIAEINTRRKTQRLELLDERGIDRMRVASLTLRNESRFLDQGDVTIEVAVDYLRAFRANSRS